MEHLYLHIPCCINLSALPCPKQPIVLEQDRNFGSSLPAIDLYNSQKSFKIWGENVNQVIKLLESIILLQEQRKVRINIGELMEEFELNCVT